MTMMSEEQRELAALREHAAEKLDAQAARAWRFQTYYDGEEDIPALIDTDERRTFRKFLAEAGANWCELIVNAVADRLAVTGFRFAGSGSADAWAIWQASSMDADSKLVQKDALVTSTGVVLVQPDDSNPTGVSITAESPLEATVLYEPGNRRRRMAGYKRFGADHDRTEVLILPDEICTWHGGTGYPDIEPNPAGEVGMIEVVPQPRTFGWPRSELTPCLPIQDRINTTIFARLVATDYGAFRQVWASGVKMAREVLTTPTDDGGTAQTTRAVRPYDIGVNRLLTNENPAGRFGAIPESTLSGYLSAVEQDVGQMAAITQTPAHYLTGSMINLSADAIKAAEAGLVSKVSDRALFIGEAWEETIRCALRLTGNPAAADTAAEIIWRDFETRSVGQLADSLVKMATLGVPRRVLWEKYGASPQEVERWEQLAAAEQAANAATAAVALGAPDEAYARLLAAAGGQGAGT
jgi:hypothetical protein